MVKIYIPPDNNPERTYIIEVIFSEFLGIEDFQIEIKDNLTDYEIIIDGANKIVVRDHFFSRYKRELEYLKYENIPKKVKFIGNKYLSENDLPVIFGENAITEGKTTICDIDIFASSFFMLTRWEEYVNKQRDKFQRFSSKYSLSYNNDFLHRPVVNEYCELLWNLMNHAGYNKERAKRKFTPYITHDVDYIHKWKDLYSFAHTIAGDLFKRMDLIRFYNNSKDFFITKLKLKNDPYDTFDYLMTLSENNGLKSHFFFISSNNFSRFNGYSISDPGIGKLLDKINKRGHHIGIHPDIGSFNNPEKWRNEYINLIKQANQKIEAGRQHILQIEIPVTWQIYDDMGMVWDSTLTYDDEPGFRSGSCYTYSVFNFLTRKKLKLKEKPLIIMDKALVLKHKEMDFNQLEKRARELIDTVKKYEGDFVLLWHNSCLYEPEWKYFRLYPILVNYLGSLANKENNSFA